jgi:hypothetical protein
VSGRHDVGVEWAQTATIIGALIATTGAQAFLIARALDALRTEMHRGFDALGQSMVRLEARVDHLAERGPPTLRRV